MFGGTTGELALIFVLGLLVFGPERLPGLARNLGRLIRRSRVLTQTLWSQLEDEIDRGEQDRERKTSAAALAESSRPIKVAETAPSAYGEGLPSDRGKS